MSRLIPFTAFALALLAASAMKWWHTIEAPEPLIVKAVRGLVALIAIVTIVVAVGGPRWRQIALFCSVTAALIPTFLIVALVTVTPAAVRDAVVQTDQARRLTNLIGRTDRNTQIAFLRNVEFRSIAVPTNDYTIADAAESVSYFAKGGMFVGQAAGIGLLVVSLGFGSGRGRRPSRRAALGFVGLTTVAAALMFGPLEASNLLWHRARFKVTEGRYTDATRDFDLAAKLDPRLNDDARFQNEFGRVEGRAGIRSSRYWCQAVESGFITYDSVSQYNKARRALEAYRRNVGLGPPRSYFRLRLAHLLLKIGSVEYRTGNCTSAARYFREGLALDSTDMELLYALGTAYQQGDNFALAIPVWLRVIKLNEGVGIFKSKFAAAAIYRKPITARAWSRLAYCYYRLGDHGRTRICLKNAVQIGSSDPSSVQG